MATGDVLALFTPYMNEPPASAFMTPDTRNAHPVLDADDTTNETAIFTHVMPSNYTGGVGINARVGYSMSSATTGAIVITVEFERIGDQQLDIDSNSFASAQSVTVTVPGTSGNVDVATINFTSGAQVDDVVAGEQYRIRLGRTANSGSDTAAGDAEFHYVELVES